MLVTDSITRELKPAKAAFQLDDDGVSVYSQSAMTDLGVEPVDLLKRSQNFVVRLAVDDVRGIDGVDVVGDPWPLDVPEPDHPRNGAHALIKGVEKGIPKELRRGRRDALLALSYELHRLLPS